jgi:hypothetical protein
MGLEPSGRRINLTGIRVDRLVDGRIVETWASWDVLGMLEQIGALPQMRREFRPVLRPVRTATAA